jgi:ferredoxin
MDREKIQKDGKPLHKIRIWRDSTLAFIREAKRTPGFSFFDFLHGYVYLRWPYLYIGVGTGEHRLSKWIRPVVNIIGKIFISSNGDRKEKPTVAETYHGKVVPLDAAKQLVMVQESIEITNLEQIIPFRIARDIILQHPDHIAVIDCPCRASRSEPCLPMDVCLIIGEPFASLVVEHHPDRSRWITSEEAQEILEAEHKRGHVHHAYFKDAMLGRFYAICNCCSCCCGAMQAVRNGSPMIISSGYVCHLDQGVCIDCGVCMEFCQFGALSYQNGSLTVDGQTCMGCGVCVSVCPVEALSLKLDPEKPAPLEMDRLIQEAMKEGST